MDVETPMVNEKSLKRNVPEQMDVKIFSVTKLLQLIGLLASALLLISLIIVNIRKVVKKRKY